MARRRIGCDDTNAIILGCTELSLIYGDSQKTTDSIEEVLNKIGGNYKKRPQNLIYCGLFYGGCGGTRIPDLLNVNETL